MARGDTSPTPSPDPDSIDPLALQLRASQRNEQRTTAPVHWKFLVQLWPCAIQE